MHTQNLQANPRASLLVTQEATDGEPLGASRITLVGNVLPVPGAEVAEARELYLARHANSRYWVDFEDFSFYHMNVVDVYYVGGFGVMGWVSAIDYDRSQPDPLAESMAEIIQHMNADHKDALVLLARKFAHVESQDPSGYLLICCSESRPSYCLSKRTSIHPDGNPVSSFVPSSGLQAFVLIVLESGYGWVNTSESQFMQTTLSD